MHGFINANFLNVLQRVKARKLSHSAHVILQMKRHEPFSSFFTKYRHPRGGRAGFPKPAKALSQAELCAVQRENSPSCATEGQWEFTPFLSLGVTGVFDLSCRIQSVFYLNFGPKQQCSPDLVIAIQKYKLAGHSVYQLHLHLSAAGRMSVTFT